jgi:hypothetical protein
MYRGVSLFRAIAGASLAVLALASRSMAITTISGDPSAPAHVTINVTYSIAVAGVYSGK